jgi:hypothetical protein
VFHPVGQCQCDMKNCRSERKQFLNVRDSLPEALDVRILMQRSIFGN